MFPYDRRLRDHQHDHGHQDHDFEEALPKNTDPAQESLAAALQSGFNVLRFIMVALVVLYFASGWFQVNPGEQGVIVRFGELRINNAPGEYEGTPVFGEGVHFSFPRPIDVPIKLTGTNEKLEVVSFSPPLRGGSDEPIPNFADLDLRARLRPVDKLQPGTDGTMITGDRGLTHGVWSVEFRVADAASYVENIGESEAAISPIITRLFENAVIRTVASMPVERVVRTQRDDTLGDFTRRVRTRLQRELDALDSGVAVINVDAKTAEPGMVRRAFLQVTDARADRQKNLDEARQERTRILSAAAGPEEKYEALLTAIRAYGAAQQAGASVGELEQMRAAIDELLLKAEGEVSVRIRRANAMATQQRERISNEFAEYQAALATWRQHPEATVLRLWTHMRERVFANIDLETLFLPDADIIEILTGRDQQRAIEADTRRYREEVPIE